MKRWILWNQHRITIFALSLLVMIVFLGEYLYGYYDSHLSTSILKVYFLFGFLKECCFQPILIFTCICMTIISYAIKKPAIGFSLAWIGLLLLGTFLSGIGRIVGAMSSYYQAEPEHIYSEARLLIEDYPRWTCFGEYDRPPCMEPLPLLDLPPSIQDIYPRQVVILDNGILIVKAFGYRGFVLWLEGEDPWEGEPAVQSQGIKFWKIRMDDNIYWFSLEDPALMEQVFVNMYEELESLNEQSP